MRIQGNAPTLSLDRAAQRRLGSGKDIHASRGPDTSAPTTEERSFTSDQSADARRQLTGLIGGYRTTAVIGALARLGVADALGAEPATSKQLAASLDADEDALTRLMEAALDVGLFAVDHE